MNTNTALSQYQKPEILAPAGNKAAFFAAVSAGADAVYCGMKRFSARMEAKNFTVSELAGLVRLSRRKHVKVYVAVNTLLTTDDLSQTAELLNQLVKYVQPDALIVQDLAVIALARQTGFGGEIHLSTLANVGIPGSLDEISRIFRVDRVVMPRELTIDEIKSMANACPPGMNLEVFVHGALCYAVSGRCYWSSFLGGKSGLKGRCVQPCRRLYEQNCQKNKFFSCQDLSLDVLVKVLKEVPRIAAWKIEGRKKGPHYVYYTTSAYRILRDEGNDPAAKKAAVGLLERALGRPGTHYFFLPQRMYNPVSSERHTGSGLFIAAVSGLRRRPIITPREALFPGDVLRVGYEDETWHKIYRVGKYVPKKGRFELKVDSGKGAEKGTPVFLIDRREKELQHIIAAFQEELDSIPPVGVQDTPVRIRLPKKTRTVIPFSEMFVYRGHPYPDGGALNGVWLSHENAENAGKKKKTSIWWWLPPVVWPADEENMADMIGRMINRGQKQFVLNAPWQRCFFDDPEKCRLWAGPFCNAANPVAVDQLKAYGFSGVIVSPELSKRDFSALPKNSPLPLGIVVSGNWPLCISRSVSEELETKTIFTSPKNEGAWAVRHGSNIWVYPNWNVDIRSQTKLLKKAGYRLFVNLIEPLPETVTLKKRPGKWNWDLEAVEA
ncbi:MAG: peptidase U32 family protein [Desulfobacterales bacterium]